MNDLKEKIEEAVKGGFTANPRTFEQIKNMGIDVQDGSKIIPWETYVNKLFSEERKNRALEIANHLPEIPALPYPAVVFIYKEIIKCIALGVNGAAITLTCVLVEYMLKFATYKVEVGAFGVFDEAKWDQFEDIPLSKATDRAAQNGLLSDERKASLKEFAKQIRNPYLHYNIKKIVSGVTMKGYQRMNINTGEIEVLDLPAATNPIVQPQSKRFVDTREVIPVFRYANEFVIEMWGKISHLH